MLLTQLVKRWIRRFGKTLGNDMKKLTKKERLEKLDDGIKFILSMDFIDAQMVKMQKFMIKEKLPIRPFIGVYFGEVLNIIYEAFDNDITKAKKFIKDIEEITLEKFNGK